MGAPLCASPLTPPPREPGALAALQLKAANAGASTTYRSRSSRIRLALPSRRCQVEAAHSRGDFVNSTGSEARPPINAPFARSRRRLDLALRDAFHRKVQRQFQNGAIVGHFWRRKQPKRWAPPPVAANAGSGYQLAILPLPRSHVCLTARSARPSGRPRRRHRDRRPSAAVHGRGFSDAARQIPGGHTKNLFVKDKKGRLFLLVLGEETMVDLKRVHEKIGGQGRVSFGSADLLDEVWGVRRRRDAVWRDQRQGGQGFRRAGSSDDAP